MLALGWTVSAYRARSMISVELGRTQSLCFYRYDRNKKNPLLFFQETVYHSAKYCILTEFLLYSGPFIAYRQFHAFARHDRPTYCVLLP